MTTVSMSEMQTKFKECVQPHLDMGQLVQVVDKKTGAVKCQILPPNYESNKPVDWKAIFASREHVQVKIIDVVGHDVVQEALRSNREDRHLIL